MPVFVYQAVEKIQEIAAITAFIDGGGVVADAQRGSSAAWDVLVRVSRAAGTERSPDPQAAYVGRYDFYRVGRRPRGALCQTILSST
jgi:hypothetical protein